MVEIEAGLRAIIAPETVFEIRALKVARNGSGYASTWSGYFNDPALAAKAIEAVDGRAVGVYVTINPVHDSLLSRAANRIRELRSGDPTTSDGDIVSRRRFLLDIDPIRRAGISSTSEEHEAAIARALAIADAIAALPAPRPVIVDSGNGAQLIYAIDLASNDGLVRDALRGLAFRFDDDIVRIDTAVFNPSRITKIPGTLTMKGDDTPERPHRRSSVIENPEELKDLEAESLRLMASWMPAPEVESAPRMGRSQIDLFDWLPRYGVEYAKQREWHGGYVCKIHCPFNPEHGFDAWVGQTGSGLLSAGCWHASCQFKTWRQLRDIYEPQRPRPTSQVGHAEEPEWLAAELTDDQQSAVQILEVMRETRRAPGFTWQRLDVREALNSPIKPINWLIEGLCGRGECVVLTADTGLGKTYFSLQLALDAAAGRPALGLYDVPRPLKILWVDEEMGVDLLTDRLTRQTVGSRFETHEIDLLYDNLDIRYQQGLSLGDARQLAIYDETLREGRYDLVFVDSMVALSTGSENSADDARAFYRRCVAPYKGMLGTAFWTLAHPPKPHKDAPPDAKHRPRGTGDKINQVERSFYLEKESELEELGAYVLRVSIHRDKKRSLGAIDNHIIAIDGLEARPVRVHSEGAGSNQTSKELARVNVCAQDMLVKLRAAPNQRCYQPAMIKELEDIGYDKRNHIVAARNMLSAQQILRLLPPLSGAPEGNGKWLLLTDKGRL
jgi:hypothetical protein